MPETESRILGVLNVINTLTHLSLGAVAFSAIYFANGFTPSSLTQHIYLCVIGYVILMSQAILSLSPNNGWSSPFQYRERRMIHWVMQVLGSSLAVAGSIVRISGIQSHFNSAHAIFGIIAMVLTILSFLGGVINLYSTKLKLNGNLIKLGHACFGTLTISCAFITLCMGFHNLYRVVSGDNNANLSIILTVFALVGTILSACMGMYRRTFK